MKKMLACLLVILALPACTTVNIYEGQGSNSRRDGVRVINPCTQGGCNAAESN